MFSGAAAMMYTMVMAMALKLSFAQDAPFEGPPSCKCKGKLDSKIPIKDCTYPFADTGKCVDADEDYGNIPWFKTYPADYGSGCKAWPEPSQADCFNASEEQVPKVPQKLLAPTKDWCNNKWCYVDPCQCDAPDVTASSTFSSHGVMKYSYSACGAVDSFTASEASDKIGSGDCDVTMSGVPFPQTLGFLSLSVATFACVFIA